jgi:hypothetical protein
MFLYRNILKQAWLISWRNKYLWFFGIFAALLGNGAGYEILTKSFDGGTLSNFWAGWERFSSTGIFSWQVFHNIRVLMIEDALSMILMLFVLLAVLVLLGFLLWLAVASQAALVNNAAAVISKKNVNFQNGLVAGTKYFWPVLGVNILVKAAIYAIFILISLPVVFTAGKVNLLTANFIYVLAFIVFIPLAIGLAFMSKYAIAYLIINKQNFGAAIKNGWEMFIKNWLVSFEMAFMLFFINLAVGLAVVLAILTLAIPFLFLTYVFYYLFSLAGFWLMVTIGFLGFLAIVILAGSILAVFQISAWTDLFLQLNQGGVISKIMRMVKK